MSGAVAAGNGDITMDVWNGGLTVTNNLTARNNVRLSTRNDINTTGNISGYRLDIVSNNGGVVLGGALTSLNDTSIQALFSIIINGPVTSGDDIRITSSQSNVMLNAPLTARDDITIWAGDKVFRNSTITAGGHVSVHG